MPPGTGQAIETATSTGRTDIVVLVCIVVTGGILATAMFRYLLKRLDEADDFQRTTLINAIDDNTIAWGHFGVVLRSRPCLSDSDAMRLTDRTPTDEEIEALPPAAKNAYRRRQENLAKKRDKQQEGGDDA